MPYADEYVDDLVRDVERCMDELNHAANEIHDLRQANHSLSEDILRLQMKYDDMRDIARRLAAAL